ncbi:MAG: hypothetical protein GSR86_06700 [Desulfurococcales archaeon]|nr:hypothetical protein [Desulfurococcales archaeon]
MLILIEHMEDRVSRWVLEEYLESSRVAEGAGMELIVTGVSSDYDYAVLSSRGVNVSREHSWELCDDPKTIVLDLWASRDLSPHEAMAGECFVIGGIMGDHPPRGRGRLLTMHFDWAAFRRLGPRQLSVDGAVKVLTMLRGGVSLDRIEFVESPTFRIDTGLGSVEVLLPFSYPVRDGKPWISSGLLRLLARGLEWDEAIPP